MSKDVTTYSMEFLLNLYEDVSLNFGFYADNTPESEESHAAMEKFRAEIDRRLTKKNATIADLLGKLASIEHIAAHSADSPEVYECWSGGRSYKDAIGVVIDIARKAMEEHE